MSVVGLFVSDTRMAVRVAVVGIALLAPASVTCGSEITTGVGGGGEGGASSSSVSAGGNTGGFNPTGSTSTGPADAGAEEGDCGPTFEGFLSGAMVSTCCDDAPCWGHCLNTPSGPECNCYGIVGGCPVGGDLVCCSLSGGECRYGGDCPPTP